MIGNDTNNEDNRNNHIMISGKDGLLLVRDGFRMRRDGQVNTHIDYFFFFLNSHFFLSLPLPRQFGALVPLRGCGGGPSPQRCIA